MKIEGKVTSVTLNEQGGHAAIQTEAPAGPSPAPGGMRSSISVNFTSEHSAEFSALVGKTVVVEISEAV